MDRGEAGDRREGVVIRSQSGYCTVLCDGVEYLCKLRGRLKQGKQRARTVAVAGDRVAFRPVADAGGDQPGGVVEEVLPRANKISRSSSRRDRGRTEQVLMANLDQIVAVQSVCQPAPMTGFVDRMLVAAEQYGVEGLLCVNKIDLDPTAGADPRWDHYADVGYALLRTSARDRFWRRDSSDESWSGVPSRYQYSTSSTKRPGATSSSRSIRSRSTAARSVGSTPCVRS